MERLDVPYTVRTICMDSATLQNNLAVPSKRKPSYYIHQQVLCESHFKNLIVGMLILNN